MKETSKDYGCQRSKRLDSVLEEYLSKAETDDDFEFIRTSLINYVDTATRRYKRLGYINE